MRRFGLNGSAKSLTPWNVHAAKPLLPLVRLAEPCRWHKPRNQCPSIDGHCHMNG